MASITGTLAMSEPIPVTNLKLQYERHALEISRAIEEVLQSGWYILGSQVMAFEDEFAAWLGAEYCLGVASGTDAVSLALASCGIGCGDEVVTVSHSAVATVAAIERIGAVPVFVDIVPGTRCLDPALIEKAISPATKAVVPVHIYGQPAPMQQISAIAAKYDLKIVEDCAQAHGAEIDGQRVGTFGDAAAFSFYPTKNLGAMGDGGAVVTNNADIAAQCRYLREYGWKERYISYMPGFNSRLDEMQATILRVKLKYLDEDNRHRRQIASLYDQALEGSGMRMPQRIKGTQHAMHLYVIESGERDRLRTYLSANNIQTALHYPVPIHLQPAYSGRIRGCDQLPVTEKLYEKILTLPLFPGLTDSQVDRVCKALICFDKGSA